jgi:D-ribose pyranase
MQMKKTTLIHSDLSYLIATLGHMDTPVIADAGLPIPAETLRIDLALTQGIPGAVQTLKVVLDEMKVEASFRFQSQHVNYPCDCADR